MRLVKPSYEILNIDKHALQTIELAGRTRYKSEDRITPESADPFVQRIVRDFKHESVIEHASITVKFIVDRGVTHELVVRHRLRAFSQESTRYCNYGRAGHVTFVIPPWLNEEVRPCELGANGWLERIGPAQEWLQAMCRSEAAYLNLLRQGWSPQQARSVLPNSLKTEIITTANFRKWRHILKLRTAKAAHPQMREVMIPLLADLANRLPSIFGDIPCPPIEQ